jgi:hypothetical protein
MTTKSLNRNYKDTNKEPFWFKHAQTFGIEAEI